MGTWGFGVFESDIACDFASTVAEGGGIIALAKALDRVLSCGGDYLEAPDAEEGLAASEIIARLIGQLGRETAYTAPIDVWVKSAQATASDELVEKAKRAIVRIVSEPSELLGRSLLDRRLDKPLRVITKLAHHPEMIRLLDRHGLQSVLRHPQQPARRDRPSASARAWPSRSGRSQTAPSSASA